MARFGTVVTALCHLLILCVGLVLIAVPAFSSGMLFMLVCGYLLVRLVLVWRHAD